MSSVKPFKRDDLRLSLHSKALLHNVKALRSCCEEGVKFCAVVKANAYGHGICEVVNILKDAEVDFFCVANIYEAFYTTKDSGLGMGLSICKSIIENHGGELGYSQNETGGSRFCFSLPVEKSEN